MNNKPMIQVPSNENQCESLEEQSRVEREIKSIENENHILRESLHLLEHKLQKFLSIDCDDQAEVEKEETPAESGLICDLRSLKTYAEVSNIKLNEIISRIVN